MELWLGERPVDQPTSGLEHEPLAPIRPAQDVADLRFESIRNQCDRSDWETFTVKRQEPGEPIASIPGFETRPNVLVCVGNRCVGRPRHETSDLGIPSPALIDGLGILG
jgi:hypothetical protein